MKKEKKTTIKSTLIAVMVLPVVVIAVLLSYLGCNSIQRNLKRTTIEGLRFTAIAVKAALESSNGYDFTISTAGHLVKGTLDLTADPEYVDAFVEGTDAEITIFYGNTRYASTITDESGERLIGSTCSEAIYDTVIRNGQDYSTDSAMFNDEQYYAYYIPLADSNGNIIGMIFAGYPYKTTESTIKLAITTLSVSSTFVLIICVIISIWAAIKIAKGINASAIYLEKIANGDLSFDVSDELTKRSDEFGKMGKDFIHLRDTLKRIMGNIQTSADDVLNSGNNLETMATQTSTTADEISHAVDDISKGAISQAEDVEHATVKVNEMGDLIEEIVHQIEALDETSKAMKEAGDASSEIMSELSQSNDETVQAIEEVARNVAATDESVDRIAEAVGLIASIADQTNLLSLNASIEAARAGEAGKGFAVVATEIQKLSVESNESTIKIKEAITELSNDSKRSMEVMAQVKEKLAEQQAKLSETKEKFESVSEGINTSKAGTDEISGRAKNCDDARVDVVDIVSSLSALSEENAASSEQTTASMQQLNATINLLAESSHDLKDLAVTLQEETKYFKI